MVSTTALLGLAALVSAAAVPSVEEGLKNPVKHPSVGGFATCTSGIVSVQAKTTKNEKLNFASPKNQSQVTEFFLELFSAGSTTMKDVAGPPATVSGTYDIYSTICVPKSKSNSSTVQFLTHGIGLTGDYWDFAKGFSYTDVAAQHGYATFYYDRLGVGKSSTPDPIQVVQASLEVEVANNLITMLRQGKIGGQKYSKVVAAGQSFGSAITVGVASEYPKSVDAVVLTGFSVDNAGMPIFLSNNQFSIASGKEPKKFKGLPTGYLVTANINANQFCFFKEPGYPPAILERATAGRGTATFGELLTIGSIIKTAKGFKGPVTVVDGDSDLPFCNGNCTYPSNIAAGVHQALFPNTTVFSTYIAPLAGHGLNFHYSAEGAFEHIQKFVKTNNL